MLIATQQTNLVGLWVIGILTLLAFIFFILALLFGGGKEDKDRAKRWIKMHPVEKDPEDTLVEDHITVWRKKAQ